jgi:tetratricopeptide (TPR) repeat protein/transcriptional regulator with XRE-family HTH domain
VFGRLVRDHRLRLGLSQADVAARSGLGERGLRNIEAGRIARPRPATVRLLADTFGLRGEERDRFCAAALIDGDPAASPPEAAAPAAASVPAQLPAALSGFTGRADNLAALAAIVERGGATMLTVAITGTAGVGKTTLAIHWAHQVKDRYPGGQLYVNLRGFDPEQGLVSPDEALGGFLTALGVPAAQTPASPAERAALFRSIVASRPLLVVLDNARDAEHVRLLLPGDAGSLVVVTSRNQMTSLVATEGAYPLPLTVLGDDEARSLLAARIGAARVAAEPAAVAEIVARCAQLPLALSVVAARAATQPDTPLAGLAAELREADGTLDALDGGDAVTNVRAVFSWSYRALSPGAGRLFRLLGVHPGSDVDGYAAAATAGVSPGDARTLLAELAGASLLSEPRPGRFACHDLLRAYAAGQAGRAEADAALTRLFDHYLYTSAMAANALFPSDAHVRPRIAEPDSATPEVHDAEHAARWLAAEHANLLSATAHAATHDWPAHAVGFGRTLFRYTDDLGRFADSVILQRHARDAARRIGDGADIGRTLRYLGHAYFRQELWAQATECFEQAVPAFAEVGEERGMALTHSDRAGVAMYSGDGRRAVEGYEHALRILRTLDDPHIVGLTLMNAAEAYDMVGDYPRAVAYLEEAIPIFREVNDRQLEVAARDTLGGTYRRLGRYDAAIDEFVTALSVQHERSVGGGVLNSVRNNLARAYLATGKLRPAADYTRLALADSRALGDHRMLGYALTNHGRIEQEREHPAAALEAIREAVTLFATIKDKAGLAYAHNALGAVLRRGGDPAAARAEHAAALVLSTEAGDRYEQAFAHDGLAHAWRAAGDDAAAVREWTAALDLARGLAIPLADEVSGRLAAIAA